MSLRSTFSNLTGKETTMTQVSVVSYFECHLIAQTDHYGSLWVDAALKVTQTDLVLLYRNFKLKKKQQH